MIARTMHWIRERRVVLGLFAIALVLRSVWVIAASRDGMPFNDTYFYDFGARMVAQGKGYLMAEGLPSAQWPPGYSTVLAGLYRVFGAHVLVEIGRAHV